MENVIGDDLETVFRRYAERPFLLVRPGGNWGDELIYWGARSLANKLSIAWQEIDCETLLEQPTEASSVVYIHGGGGFNPYSSGRVAKALFHALKHHRGVVIQGPQTFITEKDQLHSMIADGFDQPAAEAIVMFVREEASLSAVKPILPTNVSIGLKEDTAFYIQKDDVERRVGEVRHRYDLMAIREDSEGYKLQPPPKKQAVIVDPAYFATSFDHWLRLHAAAKRIVTNRTHSSILGAILGTPTTLYAGRYHKNRSIWEYSLRKRGVEWLDDCDLQIKPETLDIGANRLRDRFSRSWKVQRFGKWLQGVPLS